MCHLHVLGDAFNSFTVYAWISTGKVSSWDTAAISFSIEGPSGTIPLGAWTPWTPWPPLS